MVTIVLRVDVISWTVLLRLVTGLPGRMCRCLFDILSKIPLARAQNQKVERPFH